MSAITDADPSTDWNRIFVGYFSLFVLGFLDTSRGPFFPDITTDLAVSDTVASLFYVIASLLAAASGFGVGRLAARFGLANVLRAGHLLLGLGCLGFAMSPHFTALALASVIFGIGFGFINVGENLVILEGSAPARRRQFLSGLHSVYALASLAAPLLISFLAVQGFDWRSSYRAFFFLGAAGFFATFMIQGPPRRQVTAEGSPKAAARHARTMPSWRQRLPFATQVSLYICGELTVSTRLVLLLRREYGLSEEFAPQYLAWFFILMLLGRLLFTFIPFRGLSNRQILSAALLMSTVVVCLGLIFSPLWLVLSGLTMAPVFGISIDHLAASFPRSSAHVISWVLAVSCFFIVAMHFTLGYLTDLFGIGHALYLGPVFLLVSFLFLQLSERHPEEVHP